MKQKSQLAAIVALLGLTAVSTITHSAPKLTSKKNSVTEENIRSRAISETQISGQSLDRASEAQVSGMLKLEDPRPKAIDRSWVYFGGLSAQSFQPSGSASNDTENSFNLESRESSFLPSLELGVLSRTYAIGKGILANGGVRIRGSFTSQQGSVSLKSGYEINDARLSTSLLSAGLLFRLSSEVAPRWGMTISPQTGVVTYTQTSSNSFAQFSKSFSFDSWGLGVDYAVTQRWSIFTEWTQRIARDPGTLALQTDNFELGAKLQW